MNRTKAARSNEREKAGNLNGCEVEKGPSHIKKLFLPQKQPRNANKAFTFFNLLPDVGIPSDSLVDSASKTVITGRHFMTSDPKSLATKVATHLRRLAILPNSHLIVAASGGLDSMVLLHLLSHLPKDARPLLTVAHLNHGLRRSESAEDQRLVKSICEKSRLPFVTHTLDSVTITNAHRQTIEEAARSLRYQWLENVAQKAGSAAIVTGHHADDQTETVVHHLSRGTGLRGLQGMLPDRRLPSGIRLLRPLIAFSRRQLQAYANLWQVEFRDDSTNIDTAFTRNKIRHQLIPRVSAENQPDFPAIVNQLASSAAEAVSLLDQISQNLADASIVTRTANHVLLRVESIEKQPQLIRSHFFTWLWIQQAWPRQKMTSPHWQKLSEAITEPESPRFQLPGRVDVIRTGQWIRLVNHFQS